MRASLLILLFALRAAQAGGDGASPPDSSGRRDPGADLDFLIGEDVRPPMAAPKHRPSHAWIYWTAAGAAAACGGLGWYWREANAKPAVTRNEQIFSDAH